jgi:ABC-type multidrug transport system ATPase subunit
VSIELHHVFKAYNPQITALRDVSLRIDHGLFGLLGPNGAGKTTLLRILASIMPPTSGKVLIDGYDLSRTKDRQLARQSLGYLPQETALYPDLSGEEFLDYFGLLKGVYDRRKRHSQIANLLAMVNLTSVTRKKVKTYSGGMKRRLGLAQAFLGNPSIVIVDEPTAGLDPEERIRIRKMLTELAHDKTILLSTHVVEDITQTCEQTIVFYAGQVLFQGRTNAITTLAQGYTWELLGTEKEIFPSTLQIVARVPGIEGVSYRLVGEPDARHQNQVQAVSPTLEDGYVRLLQSSITSHSVSSSA